MSSGSSILNAMVPPAAVPPSKDEVVLRLSEARRILFEGDTQSKQGSRKGQEGIPICLRSLQQAGFNLLSTQQLSDLDSVLKTIPRDIVAFKAAMKQVTDYSKISGSATAYQTALKGRLHHSLKELVRNQCVTAYDRIVEKLPFELRDQIDENLLTDTTVDVNQLRTSSLILDTLDMPYLNIEGRHNGVTAFEKLAEYTGHEFARNLVYHWYRSVNIVFGRRSGQVPGVFEDDDVWGAGLVPDCNAIIWLPLCNIGYSVDEEWVPDKYIEPFFEQLQDRHGSIKDGSHVSFHIGLRIASSGS